MAKYTSPLNHVRISAPCTADWDAMIGTESKRFCGQCRLNVYNLSGMTRREAEQLIASAEGRLCVRFYRRADGTILTENCPVGLRALKRRLSRIRSATVSAILSFLAGLGLYTALDEREPVRTMGVAINPTVMGTVPAYPPPEIVGPAVMGDIAIAPAAQGEMVRQPVMGRHLNLREERNSARNKTGRRKR